MESLYKLVKKKLISYLYTILLNKLCATDQILVLCIFPPPSHLNLLKPVFFSFLTLT